MKKKKKSSTFSLSFSIFLSLHLHSSTPPLTGIDLDQVVVDHVVQLRGDLHPRGPTAAHDERQEPFSLLGQGLRQGSPLEALGDVAAELGRVLDRLEEKGVLLGGGLGGRERKN
jgi:hypothetical protein